METLSRPSPPAGAALPSFSGGNAALPLLEEVLQSSHDAISVWDSQGRLLFGNHSLAVSLGFASIDEVKRANREGLLGRIEIFDARGERVPPSDLPSSRALRGAEVRGELLRQRRQGSLHDRWYRVDAVPRFGADGKVDSIILIGRDVTDFTNSREELRIGEERYRLALDAGRLGAWDWDIVHDSIAWSPQIYAIHGLSPGAFGGKVADFDALVHEADKERVGASLNAALEGRGDFEVEFRTVWPDGSLHWVWTQARVLRGPRGEPLRMVGVTTDITDRKRRDEALRRSEAEFRAVFDLAAAGKVLADPATRRILHVNRKMIQLTGFTEAELLSLTQAELVHAEDREADREETEAVLEGRSEGWIGEKRYLRKDGSFLWVQVAGTLISDGEGRPYRLIATVYDISARRTAEEEARQALERMRQAQKMEAVGKLAGGIAHDFNNMLTAINGYSDLLLGQLPETPETAMPLEMIREIRKAGERASLLTRQLLAYGRQQVMSFRPLDLNAVVRGLLPLFSRLLPENILIRSRFDASLPPVFADASQMEQVVMNLVINARDAMPEGGNLFIATKAASLVDAGAFENAVALKGAYAVIEVRDEGTGIPPEIRKRIFEPFFTTKEMGHGTGMGLATVYGIVEQSGGYISLQSHLRGAPAEEPASLEAAPPAGTCFGIWFPAHAPKAPSPSGSAGGNEAAGAYSGKKESAGALSGCEDAVKEPSGNKEETKGGAAPKAGRILVVEDEASVRGFLKEVLAGSGFEVVEAAHGEEALERAGKAGPFDLLITDMMMPGLSGRQTAEAFRARFPGLSVLFLSGYSPDTVTPEALPSGMYFLAKPFSPSSLLAQVRTLLRRAD